MFCLILPVFLVISFVGSLIAFFRKKWGIGIVLLIMAIVINSFGEIVGWHLSGYKNESTIKLMAFNVHSSDMSYGRNKQRILELIEEENPDFVYLSELETAGDSVHSCLIKTYPFTNIPSVEYSNHIEPVYSRWPIDTVETLSLPHFYHSIYRVRINQGKDTVSVYCCHLSSNQFMNSSHRFDSIKEGYLRRAKEADELHMLLSTDPYPTILLGDLNDIGGSYTLRHIESAGMKDAWWEGGLGYGATYHDHGLRLRLDHILFDDSAFQLSEIKTIGGNLSDHKGLVASFKLLHKN